MNNTYFELINYIYSLENKDNIDSETISQFNKYNVYLEGERYNRFINHLTNLLDERINEKYSYIINKVIYLENEREFEDNINLFFDESNSQINLINNKLVKDNEKQKLLEFIKTNNNEVIDRLKKYYDKYNNIINFLDNYYIK